MKVRIFLTLLLLGALNTLRAETLTLVGSGTVATAITRPLEEFKKSSGVDVTLQPKPSIRGVFGVAEGQAEIGLTIAEVTDAQRKLFPSVDFHTTTIGRGGLYLLVSPDVWDAGVRALSREQVLGVVEKKVVSWKELGGADEPITFFPPGGGSLENFGTWLFGKFSPELEAKLKKGGELRSPILERANEIASRRGTLTVLSEHFRPGASKAQKLAILIEGRPVDATTANLQNGTYPLSFDLRLITNGPPKGAAKKAIDFLLSEAGQKLIEDEGYGRARAPAQKASK
jgi:phosphate transport system substrate-binding protein